MKIRNKSLLLHRTILDNYCISHTSNEDESLFIYVLNGNAEFNGIHLEKGGHVRVKDSEELFISAKCMADLIFISM